MSTSTTVCTICRATWRGRREAGVRRRRAGRGRWRSAASPGAPGATVSDAERRCATVSNSCRPLSINSGRQPTGNLSSPLDVLPTPSLGFPAKPKPNSRCLGTRYVSVPIPLPTTRTTTTTTTRKPGRLSVWSSFSRVIESKFNLGCRFPPSWPTSRHPTPPAHHHTNHVHRLVGVASRRLYRPPRSVPDSPPRFFVRSSHSAFRSQSHPDSTTRTW